MSKPRLLANENVPLVAVDGLAQAGHDICSATRECPGATDRQLIDRARTEGRIVITFDKGYGELAYRQRLVPPGVVLLRVVPRSPGYIQQRLELLLTSPAVLAGRFTVLTDSGTRSLPLPKA